MTPFRSFEPDAVLDGTYQIVRRLAQGGMGSVYVARHLRLGGELVVKTLDVDYAATEEGRARFRREAEILARLRHPNVVQVVDFNVSERGMPYLAMELLDGPDLRTALGRGRVFSPAETMTIVRQVASALSAAHACDIIHRDLKPENVVLCRAAGQMPVVKVIDFGISLWGARDGAKVEDVVFGTPEFMAPEQAQGHCDQIDARADQFSLAVLAYTLVTGRPPFRGHAPLEIYDEIIEGRSVPLGPREGWNGDAVEAVLRKGLSATKESRYGSVLDFADALESAMLEGGAIAAPILVAPHDSSSMPTVPTPPQSTRARRRVQVRKTKRVHRRAPRSLAMAALLGLGLSVTAAAAGTSVTFRHRVDFMHAGLRSSWSRVSGGVEAFVAHHHSG
ncbi:MAG TPA: serine/threonine-protein kinase [Polyangia bacterium]|jgi:serine/threonine protein kinase|nr:serine/threonine-protein kinase [Polyangia bacterium]